MRRHSLAIGIALVGTTISFAGAEGEPVGNLRSPMGVNSSVDVVPATTAAVPVPAAAPAAGAAPVVTKESAAVAATGAAAVAVAQRDEHRREALGEQVLCAHAGDVGATLLERALARAAGITLHEPQS